jgi:hypothetical protein
VNYVINGDTLGQRRGHGRFPMKGHPMKFPVYILLSFCVVWNFSLKASDDFLPHNLWPAIDAQLAALTNSADPDEQLATIRHTIDDCSLKDLEMCPTNQLLEPLSKLSASILILSQRGDISDVARLLKFADMRISNSKIAYVGEMPISIGLVSDVDASSQKTFPACYSLSLILRRFPGTPVDAIENSVKDSRMSSEVCLRILGVLVDSEYCNENNYAAQVLTTFGPKMYQPIKDLTCHSRGYWSQSFYN